MSLRIEAVVFDFDNTLIQSRVDFGRMRTRVQDYIRRNHPQVELGDSGTTMDLLGRLESVLSGQTLTEAMARIHSIMDETEMESAAGARLLGEVGRVLAALREMGLRIGLLTRSCRRYTELVAEREGITNFFDEVSCRTHDEPLKPDPRALLRLCETLGVDAGRTLLVGDHAMDGECALRAGALFVGVTTGSSPREALEKVNPLAVLEGLGPLPALVGRINCG